MAKTKKKESPIASRIVIRQASVVRKDISDWKLAKQDATRTDQPRFRRLQELYSYILVDAHLSSQILLRKSQTLSADWQILAPSGSVDKKATDTLHSLPEFRRIISEILDSQFFGYSLIELSPSDLGFSLSSIDRRHIDPVHGLLYLNISDPSGIPFRQMREYGSSILEFNANSLGLLDQAVPHVLYKRFAQACWSEFCEICGMPPRYIKTNTQDEELRRSYEEMLSNVGSGANYVIDTDDEIGFADTNATDGSIYQGLIRLCTNELSLLVNGAVIGQDTEFGSNSKEKTSSELNSQIIDNDFALVEAEMNATVLPALASLGIIKPGLLFKFPEQEDTAQLFSQTIQAATFFDIDPAWVKEKFGIEVTGLRSMGTAQLSGKDGLDFFA